MLIEPSKQFATPPQPANRATNPAVLAAVLEAWWKIASTPGDIVDVLVAAAGAGLLGGAFGAAGTLPSDRAQPYADYNETA